MTLTHRIVIWFGLLVCAVLIVLAADARSPAVGPPTGTTWPNGDGDLVEVRD